MSFAAKLVNHFILMLDRRKVKNRRKSVVPFDSMLQVSERGSTEAVSQDPMTRSEELQQNIRLSEVWISIFFKFQLNIFWVILIQFNNIFSLQIHCLAETYCYFSCALLSHCVRGVCIINLHCHSLSQSASWQVNLAVIFSQFFNQFNVKQFLQK